MNRTGKMKKGYGIKWTIGIICVLALLMFITYLNRPVIGGGDIVTDDFTIGGIRVSDETGDETTNKKRMRTGYWPLGTIDIQWNPASGLNYFVAYYDKEYHYLKHTGFKDKSMHVKAADVEGARYVRIV